MNISSACAVGSRVELIRNVIQIGSNGADLVACSCLQPICVPFSIIYGVCKH